MKVFCTPADAILNLTSEEALIADRACCEDWFGAVEAIAEQHQIPYLNARSAIIDYYRKQRILSLYGICKAISDGSLLIYLAESVR